MARSTRKSSARGKAAKARPSEKADVEELLDEAAEADETTEPAEPTKKSAEPTKKTAEPAKKKSAGKDAAKKAADRPRGGEVAEKAKDSSRAGAKKAAAAESTRGPRRVAVTDQNPRWLVPAAITFLVLGLAYLVTFYLTSGLLPLPIGDWNLAVGFGALMVGGGMFMFWK